MLIDREERSQQNPGWAIGLKRTPVGAVGFVDGWVGFGQASPHLLGRVSVDVDVEREAAGARELLHHALGVVDGRVQPLDGAVPNPARGEAGARAQDRSVCTERAMRWTRH